MASISKTLIDVAAELGTDEKCLAYLEAIRWPGELKCGSERGSRVVSTVKNRKTGKVTAKVLPPISPRSRTAS